MNKFYLADGTLVEKTAHGKLIVWVPKSLSEEVHDFWKQASINKEVGDENENAFAYCILAD